MNTEPTTHERAQRLADFIAKADSQTRDMMHELMVLSQDKEICLQLAGMIQRDTYLATQSKP